MRSARFWLLVFWLPWAGACDDLGPVDADAMRPDPCVDLCARLSGCAFEDRASDALCPGIADRASPMAAESACRSRCAEGGLASQVAEGVACAELVEAVVAASVEFARMCHPCGDDMADPACRADMADDECAIHGGTYGAHSGDRDAFYCACPTVDAGCPCVDSEACDGVCLRADDDVCEGDAPGVCAPTRPTPGCFCWLRGPMGRVFLCE